MQTVSQHMAPAVFVVQADEHATGMHWLERLLVPSGRGQHTGEEAPAVALRTWLHQRGLAVDEDGVIIGDAAVGRLTSVFGALRVPGSRHSPPRFGCTHCTSLSAECTWSHDMIELPRSM